MGFLSNIIKSGISDGISKGINEAVGKAVEKAVAPAAERWANKTAEHFDSAAQSVEEAEKAGVFANLQRAAENYASALEHAAEGMEGQAASSSVSSEKTGTAAYFAQVIKEGIPGAEAAMNVSLSQITGEIPEKASNVDVLVVVDDVPKAAIILVPKGSYKNLCYVNAMKACEKEGIPAIRFMKEFANKPEYVVERIKKYL